MAATQPIDVAFDEYGFLVDPQDWSPGLAQAVALQLDVGELTDEHWAVIDYTREHHLKNHTLPWLEHVCHSAGLEDHCVRRLFRGPIELWKIAGLPDPGEEARTYMANEE